MSKNSLPIGVDFTESGRLNITVYKMDSGSFLLQNNESGQGPDDRVQLGVDSADRVKQILKQILDGILEDVNIGLAELKNKWEAIDIFCSVDSADDGIPEEVELSTDMNLNIDQIAEAIADLYGSGNPVTTNRIFHQNKGRGLDFSKAEIIQALRKAGGQIETVNRSRLQPKKKWHYPGRNDRTKDGNRIPGDKNQNKQNSGDRPNNEPTKIGTKE